MYRKQEKSAYCLCSILLPSILTLIYFQQYSSISYKYLLTIALNVNNVVYSNLFKFYNFNLKNFVVLALILSLIQSLFTENKLLWFNFFLLHSFAIKFFLQYIPKIFPFSFTKCELIILCQGILIVIFQNILCYISIFLNTQKYCSAHLPTRILETICFGTAFILSSSFLLEKFFKLNKIILNYVTISVGITISYFSLIKIIKEEPIFWLINFLFNSDKRVYLMKIWLICFILSFLFAFIFTKLVSTQANTIIRKFYHIVIILIFITGAKYDLNLLHFTSSAVFILFIFIEKIRINLLPPLGQTVDKIFKQFIDEKDSGILILTHIYLLVGFSLSIWIVPDLKADLFFASGLITIGFGDTSASFFGYLLGKHKWNNSNKTKEGTFAAIVAQIIGGCLYMIYIDIKIDYLILFKLCIISLITGIIEAKTVQVDNLILPFYFHLLLIIMNIIFY